MIRSRLRRASHIVPFVFPEDHGRHPDFCTEWWYLAGWLWSDDGGCWAYHFTVFRRALERWTDLLLIGLAVSSKKIRGLESFKRSFAKMLTNRTLRTVGVDGYVGHLSLVNVKERAAKFFERGALSLLGTSGARTDRLEVWIKDWRFWMQDGEMFLTAKRGHCELNLSMKPLKAPAVHGELGLSRKGPESGSASHHYSISSLATQGVVVWEGKEHQVEGKSLMDREYGTAMLPSTIQGWDWLGLFLDNDCEVMITVIRDSAARPTPESEVAIAFPNGSTLCLRADSFSVEVVHQWKSPRTGTEYPTGWLVAVPNWDLEIRIRAVLDTQELVSATSTTIDYWEGPVKVSGKMKGEDVNGYGHAELVGYAQPVGGKF